MKRKILYAIRDGVNAIQQLADPKNISFIEQSAYALAQCYHRGNKVLIAGNGGSLCDAAHFAEELTGYFREKRKALPALALTEPGHITCVGNDAGFEFVFSRALEAYGKEGDIFIGLTTSGNSPNIILAFEKAKELGMQTIAFLGKGGGKLKGVADLELLIEGFKTSDRIQEAHMAAIHMLIEIMEHILFYEVERGEILEEMAPAVG